MDILIEHASTSLRAKLYTATEYHQSSCAIDVLCEVRKWTVIVPCRNFLKEV